MSVLASSAVISAVPPPSTPLGPFAPNVVAWTAWVTLMGFVGVTAFAIIAAGPAAARVGKETSNRVATRLAITAVILGVLSLPAVLSVMANEASQSGTTYVYSGAWKSLYDGSTAGLLSGLELTLMVVATLLVVPLVRRKTAASPARHWLSGLALVASAIALMTTKWPTGPTTGLQKFGTFMWFLHLEGGGVWIGGLIGLIVLAFTGALRRDERGIFWSSAIRRFSVSAMACVAAITLSGLFLYWEHVDGLSQLWTTMYGRALGVKILLFGGLVLLGMFNQFWLHPRVEQHRAHGDDRPLAVLLLKHFPIAVTVEVLLGLSILLVAPFLHGSARNQAHQATQAADATSSQVKFTKLPPKQVSTSTWVYGTLETVVVAGVMIGGYRVSGRIAKGRTDRIRPEAVAPVSVG